MGQAVKSLTAEEKTFHIANHPVNTLYWIGSAVVFGTIFAEIALKANPTNTLTYGERIQDGFNLLHNDVKEANVHLHEVLYGLIKGLLEDALGHPLDDGDVTTIDDVPTSRQVALSPWVDITPAT